MVIGDSHQGALIIATYRREKNRAAIREQYIIIIMRGEAFGIASVAYIACWRPKIKQRRGRRRHQRLHLAGRNRRRWRRDRAYYFRGGGVQRPV